MNEAAHQLIDAIEKNDIATASSLISSGDVNLNDEPWPLHTTVRHGRLEIITLLLDAGADIDLADEGGWTACHYAIMGNEVDVLKLLVARGAGLEPNKESLLPCAMGYWRGPDDQIIIFLLDLGASVDNLNRYGLMELVRTVGVYKCLLTRGINFDAMRDESGGTLCHHVVRNATDENDLRCLLNACGTHSVNAVDNHGQTPFHWATRHQSNAAMQVLVELGADIDHRGKHGRTALHIEAGEPQRTSLSCLELLLALGADVHLVTNYGQTACHIASRYRAAALCVCVAAGGDLDQLDNDGYAPRGIAIDCGVELPSADETAAARQRIAKTRLDLVRHRATEICIGLQQLDLNALQLCEILMHAFGAIGSLIAFHQWWVIATKVKHFHDRKQQRSL
jgi:ankyrin repeat protein